MPSSIFSKMDGHGGASLGAALSSMRNGSPAQFASALMRDNPDFKRFVEALGGSDPFERARAMGVDLSSYAKMR